MMYSAILNSDVWKKFCSETKPYMSDKEIRLMSEEINDILISGFNKSVLPPITVK